jgi:hypothetical protein
MFTLRQKRPLVGMRPPDISFRRHQNRRRCRSLGHWLRISGWLTQLERNWCHRFNGSPLLFMTVFNEASPWLCVQQTCLLWEILGSWNLGQYVIALARWEERWQSRQAFLLWRARSGGFWNEDQFRRHGMRIKRMAALTKCFVLVDGSARNNDPWCPLQQARSGRRTHLGDVTSVYDGVFKKRCFQILHIVTGCDRRSITVYRLSDRLCHLHLPEC